MCDVLYGQAAVAQSVERPTAKQKIVGSSPSQGKKFQGKNVKSASLVCTHVIYMYISIVKVCHVLVQTSNFHFR